MTEPDQRRDRGRERGRSFRSWALHALVAAGGVGAVAIDRRLRRTRHGALLAPVGPLAVGVVFQAAQVALSRTHPHDEAWRAPRSEFATDVACLTASLVAAGAGQAVGEAVGAAGGSRSRRRVGRLSAPAGATVSLLAFDLVHSRFHQLLHVWGPGWRFHAMHHSPKRLYWLNAGRTQVVEIAIDAFLEGVVTRQLGSSRDQLIAHQAVRVMYGNLQHTNVDLRSGVLDHVLSTPDLHRWHHSTVYEEGDANFGVFTSIWDRLFGTFYRPNDRDCPDELGVGRMPDFPTRFVELQRVPFDWPEIRERNAATWNAAETTVGAQAAG